MKRLDNALIVIIIIIIVGSVASMFMGQYLWVLNLFAHFQLQALFILIILALLLIYRRKLLWSGITILYSAFLITLILPLTTNINAEKNPELFFHNTWIYNHSNDEIIDNIKDVNPEVVAIVELSNELEQGLENQFTNKNSVQGEYGGKCGIFSNKDYQEILYPGLTYPICAIQTPDYQLLVIHPTPPFDKNLLDKQLRHFAEISQIIDELNASGEKFIVVGDFNSASYPYYFKNYFGDYLNTNTYSWSPNLPWSIPIDHALANFEIDIDKGSLNGSDHISLLINFD